MAEILQFDPVSELEILETFDFEEDIQRPQELRFFTLEEQLVDFFEKHLPAGKPTKFELQQLRNSQYRIKNLYEQLISFTDTDYTVDFNRKSVNVSWIHPVYSEFEYKPYSFTREYLPLFDKTARSRPNYYPTLLSALPKPYVSTEEGRQLTEDSELLNYEGKYPIRGLKNYERTKIIINDDGTLDLQKLEIPNTADDLKIKGFFLDKRILDIPNPLADHPFLKSGESSFIKTEISLLDMYPSIEAILEHAVPTTTDPYHEGLKYLKLYDIKISQIPWNMWKQKFPPVETKSTSKTEVSVGIPAFDKPLIPGNVLLKTYVVPWFPVYHPRIWLSQQVDAGQLVTKLLSATSSEHGLMAASAPIEPPAPIYQVGSPDICMGLTSDFDTFLSSGLYRYSKFSKEGIPTEGVCVPIGHIQQEKYLSAYKNRTVWKESTQNDIQTDYVKLLKDFQVSQFVQKHTEYEKIGKMPESERHKDVLNILADTERSPEDKANSIELLLRDTDLKKNLYVDVDGLFVICLHTLEILRGKLEDDNMKFYSEWTTVQDGSRTCKSCGEEIDRQILVAANEYDSAGHLIQSNSVLEKETFHADNSFTNSLVQLKSLFDIENSGESVLYLMLSVLQVLPLETQLVPVLHLIRKISFTLKSRASQTKKISKTDQDRIEGLLGLSGLIVLLQTHTPFLIPKRSIKLGGFPRDSNDPKEGYILDSVVSILRKTLEAFPMAFKGSFGALSRQIIAKPQKIREELVTYVKVFADQFKLMFENARERYIVPEEEINKNNLQFPLIKIDEPFFNLLDVIGDETQSTCEVSRTLVSWTIRNLPSVIQTPTKLNSKIFSSPYKKHIEKLNTNFKLINIPTKEIESNISSGMPSGFPLISEFIKGQQDNCSITVFALRILDILSKTKFSTTVQSTIRNSLITVDNSSSPSLLRDIAKGLLFKLLHAIKSDKNSPALVRIINETVKTDLTLRMLLLSKDAAEKEEFKLRTNETNLLKSRYRSMNDTQREITKMLVDIGIADFIVTNEDRELFAKQFEKDVEREYAKLEEENDANRPEEGYDDIRDYIENGDLPFTADGSLLDPDRGEYGDRDIRDYNDYEGQPAFDGDWE